MGVYPSAAMQSMYSTASVDWAGFLRLFCRQLYIRIFFFIEIIKIRLYGFMHLFHF